MQMRLLYHSFMDHLRSATLGRLHGSTMSCQRRYFLQDPFLPEDEEDRSGFGPSGRGTGSGSGASTVSDETINAPIKKLPVAAATLAKTWKENKRISKDDWQEWMRRLMIEVLYNCSVFCFHHPKYGDLLHIRVSPFIKLGHY